MTAPPATLSPSAPPAAPARGAARSRPPARSPGRPARLRALWAGARFVAVALLAGAGTLGLLDWLLFDTALVAPRLPVLEPRLPASKLLLAERYRDARVLYLGDSRILFGVDPAVVSETCRCGPGYNAAYASADPLLNRLMAERLLRRLSPEVVVIGVSQWELSDAAHLRQERSARQLVPPALLADFGLTLDRDAQVDATLDVAWRLYRYRAEVRAALDPSTRHDRPHERRRGFLVYDGPSRLREQDLDAREREWFRDFAVAGRRADALRGLIDGLRRRGIHVMLVATPVQHNFLARIRSRSDEFRRALGQLAAEHGAPFEDLTEPDRMGLGRRDFRDPVHLNEEGAIRLSRHLGRTIRSRLGLAD